MKRITFFIGILFVLWSPSCFPSGSSANSKLVNYTFGRYDYNYFLIIPDNLEEYEYLNHYPFTAFIFLNYYDKDKLSKITVKELKSGSLGSTDSCCTDNDFFEALKFEKLKGFEAFSRILKESDEFKIAEKKNQYISKLIEIYGHYKNDYKRYLKGFDGTYKFRKADLNFSNWDKLKDYNENVEINEPTPWSYYDKVGIEAYDFDKKLFKINLLSPVSRSSSKGWEFYYVKKFNEKYRDLKYKNDPVLNGLDFPEEIQIPMSLDEAKKLFADKDDVFCETILTVETEEGAFGYQGTSLFVMASNFNIKTITKNYYKKKNWDDQEKRFFGAPVLTIELNSKEDRPLY